MARKFARWVALATIVIAPSAFSFQLYSFLHAKELIYAVASVVLAAFAIFNRDTIRVPRWTWAIAAWAIAMTLTSLAMGNHFHAPLEKLFHGLLMLTFASLARHAIVGDEQCLGLTRALSLSGALAGLLGLLQYAHIIDRWLPVFPSYDQRMYSVFGNQDLLGGYMAITLPFVLALALTSRHARRDRILGSIALFPIVLALLLSESRSAWLATALGTMLFGVLFGRLLATESAEVRRNALRLTAALVLIGFVSVVGTAGSWWPRVASTFGESDDGGNLRLWFYAGTRHMIAAHPWLGVGFGNYGFSSPLHMGAVVSAPGRQQLAHNELFVDHAHSDPLETLAEAGALGVAVLFVLLFVALRGARLQPRPAEVCALLALAVFASLNPALLSAPHTLVGLLCLGQLLIAREPDVGERGSRHWLSLLAPPIVSAWLFFTFAPSAALLHLQRPPQPDPAMDRVESSDRAFEQFVAHAHFLERYHGPWAAFEDFARWGAWCAQLHAPSANAAHFQSLMEAALRACDTGTIHESAAAYFAGIGDTARAQQEEAKVLERWPRRRLPHDTPRE